MDTKISQQEIAYSYQRGAKNLKMAISMVCNRPMKFIKESKDGYIIARETDGFEDETAIFLQREAARFVLSLRGLSGRDTLRVWRKISRDMGVPEFALVPEINLIEKFSVETDIVYRSSESRRTITKSKRELGWIDKKTIDKKLKKFVEGEKC